MNDFKDEITGLIFPQTIGKWTCLRNVEHFDTADKGYSVGYEHRRGPVATFYVYNLGYSSIGNGISSAVVSHFEAVKGDIRKAELYGYYRITSDFKDFTYKTGNSENTIEFLGSSFSIDDSKTSVGKDVSEIYLTGFRNHFIKLRITHHLHGGMEKDGVAKLLDYLGSIMIKL